MKKSGGGYFHPQTLKAHLSPTAKPFKLRSSPRMGLTSIAAVTAVLVYIRYFISVHHLGDPVAIAEALDSYNLAPDFSLLEQALELLDKDELEDLKTITEIYRPEIEEEEVS